MASYPNAIFVPRVVENKPGVEYDPAKTKIGYAEDQNLPNDEIVAIETELGTNPKGGFGSVAEFLDHLLSVAGGVPIGTIISSAAISTPSGFLACNGASISRTTHANLYEALSADKGVVTMEKADIAPPYEIWGIKVTKENHDLNTGDTVEFTTTGTLMAPLEPNTSYPIRKIDANTFWVYDYYHGEYYSEFIYVTNDAQSGVHSMRHVPYGVDGADNFKLPDLRGLFQKGNGENGQITRQVGDNYFGRLGAYEYDGDVPHKHQITDIWNSNGTTYGNTINFRSLTTQSNLKIISTGSQTQLIPEYGYPRVSRDTKPASVGVNYFIKY